MKKWIALSFAIAAACLLLLLPNGDKKQYFHNQGNIFGTYYNIRYEGTEDLHDDIRQRLQEFDQSLSMFNPNSVISKINRNENYTTAEDMSQIMAYATKKPLVSANYQMVHSTLL